MATESTSIPFFTSEDSQVVLYQPNETLSLEVKIDADHETVWLTQQQIADLFGVKQPAISKHLSNIFKSGELDQKSVHSILEYTAADGKVYKTQFYNLDAIISVGYRVNSLNATAFRRWATSVLRDYLLRGYSVNQQLLAMQRQLDTRFEEQSERMLRIEDRQDHQQQQVEFLVNIHNRPTENLFATGCAWDAYSYIATLIRSAKERIILVDNYCNDKTLTLLDQRATGIPCTIHTTFNNTIQDALDKHNAQCAPVQKIQLPHKIHDRFLIIDQTVYLLGNSVKDMGNTLSAIIQTGFTPDEILAKLK